MMLVKPDIVKEVFKHALSSVEEINIAAHFSDYLKKHSVIGFFTEVSKRSLYDYIYEGELQDEKLDFIFAIYNSIVNFEIDQESIRKTYYSFIQDNNLHSAVKDMYLLRNEGDLTEDKIMLSLYFIRLYINYFDSMLIVVNNTNKRKGLNHGS